MAALVGNTVSGSSKRFSHKKGVMPPKEWRGRRFEHILGKSPPPKILARVHKCSKNSFEVGELVVVDRPDNQKVFGKILEADKVICLVLIEPPDECFLAIARYDLRANQLGKISSKVAAACVSLESALRESRASIK